MICDRWSDVPIYDQEKINSVLDQNKSPSSPCSYPQQWPKQMPCDEYKSGTNVCAHEYNIFQVWQSYQAPKDQISGRCSAGPMHPVSELLFRKLAN